MATPTIQIDQLADAINAVPGVNIEVFNLQLSATNTSAAHNVMQDLSGATIDFAVPVVGKYRIAFHFSAYNPTTSDGVEIQFLFDESDFNGFTEQTIGSGGIIPAGWGFPLSPANNWTTGEVSGEVELESGTHRIQIQWRDYEANVQINTGGADAACRMGMTLVSGSGAGGVLVEEAVLSGDQTINSVTPADVTGLTHTIVCAADEWVEMVLRGRTERVSGTATQSITFLVDGVVVMQSTGLDGVGATQQNAGYRNNPSSSIYVQVAAGSRTLKVQAATTSGSSYKINDGAIFQVVRFRGGLSFGSQTISPRVEYNSASTVDVEIPHAIPDGPAYYRVKGAKSYLFNGGEDCSLAASGINGLDTGSEANSTWYYLYLVQSGGTLKPVFSVTAPPTGPTGYSEWVYIHAVYNDSSGNILKFRSDGKLCLFTQPGIWNGTPVTAESTATAYDGAAVQLDLTYSPVTASIAILSATLQLDGSGWCQIDFWTDQGNTDGMVNASEGRGAESWGQVNLKHLEIPIDDAVQGRVYYQKTGSGSLYKAAILNRGFIDKYRSA